LVHHGDFSNRGPAYVLLLTRPSTDTLRGSDSRQVRCYRSEFRDRMEMRADFQTVGAYLDRHEGWFRRCAAPMEVKAIDEQAYALTLGRFGNFGFEVEPTIGLRLLPQNAGNYAISTVPLSNQDPALADLYDVDFQANLSLEDNSSSDASEELTAVSWDLDLSVWIHLPKMITLLLTGWFSPVVITFCAKLCGKFPGVSPGKCKKISMQAMVLSARQEDGQPFEQAQLNTIS